MIPYVACMICIVGMGYHFSLVLMRFLDRQNRAESSGFADTAELPSDAGKSLPARRTIGWRWAIVPACVVALFALVVDRVASIPATPAGEMDLYRFGQLPLVYQGRVKPFDTLARNSLRVIADIETFNGILPAAELEAAWPTVEQELKSKYPAIQNEDLTAFKTGDTDGLIQLISEKTQGDTYAITREVEERLFKRQPAVRWLLDVITGSDQARRHKVIRIYHPQVLDVLGLQRRKYYRYSLEEIAPKMDAFQEQVRQADEVRRRDVEQLSLYQKKLLETDRKIRMVLLLHRAFSPPDLPALPTADDFQNDRAAAMDKLTAFRQALIQQEEAIRSIQPPLAVAPLAENETEWQAYAAAWPRQLLTVRFLGEDPQPSFKALNDVMLAYLDHDPQRFNKSVDDYQHLLRQNPPKELQAKPSWTTSFVNRHFGSFYQFESYFNHCAPFFYSSFLYLLAFAILCLGWLKWRTTCNRIAFWLIVCTFVVHTVALIRGFISQGVPP